MRIVVDFLPLVLYLAAYMAADLYVATAVLIAATALQVAYVYVTTRRIPAMTWVNFVAAALLGGLTLTSQDTRFLVLRASAIYWILAAVLYGVDRYAGRNLLQLFLERHFDAPASVWRRGLLAYVWFFAALGIVNLIVAHAVSEAVWVAFDTIGALIVIAVFMVLQFLSMRTRLRDAPRS